MTQRKRKDPEPQQPVTGDVIETVQIGKFEFTIAAAEDTPEVRRKWEGRIDALTDWLLAEWRREHGER